MMNAWYISIDEVKRVVGREKNEGSEEKKALQTAGNVWYDMSHHKQTNNFM